MDKKGKKILIWVVVAAALVGIFIISKKAAAKATNVGKIKPKFIWEGTLPSGFTKSSDGTVLTANGDVVMDYNSKDGYYQVSNGTWYDYLGEPMIYYDKSTGNHVPASDPNIIYDSMDSVVGSYENGQVTFLIQ
jgi:hypothetical protein